MRALYYLIIFFTFAAVIWAQEANNVTLTFNHLALSVADVDRSAEFYKNVLGLQEITDGTRTEGVRWFSFNEGKELHLISWLKEKVTINKAVHLALTTADFDNFVKILESKNIKYSDWPGTEGKINIRSDGIQQIFFQDPDGYWIEVNSVAQK